MMHLAKKTATAALIVTALAAPTAVALQQDGDSDQQSSVQLVGDKWIRTELYFGTDKPGPDVTDYQFKRFVNDTVTPRFEDGFTVFAGDGQWKDSASGNIIRERSKLVVLLYPIEGSDKSSRKIEEIRAKYKKQFDQDSVLRTDSTEYVSF